MIRIARRGRVGYKGGSRPLPLVPRKPRRVVPMNSTLSQLLAAGRADAVALSAPGRMPLTHGRLRALIAETIARLNALGIGRNDRVAIVLDNGPEMAACFIACASGVTSAPLNPAYREDEFDFYLSDLRAKALVVARGSTSPAIAVAERQGVRVLDLVAAPDAPAGAFTLEPRLAASGAPAASGASAVLGGFAEPGDVSMLLHTSGTTSRPKIVPLTQANLAASARHIRDTLQFTERDCGLNIMPLFHIHGLIAGVLAPLAAGSQVFCTPGFNALKFFGWMDEAKPTWYTAVPTMHQAILTRAGKNLDVIARHPLRFLRSSSSSIPPQVIRELEEVFNAPLIEAYGMTEATHQMASNPLPPRARKPGSVGLAAGPEIAIMDEAGQLLPRGATGEIVIRGPNVTAGYENNPKANAEAFANGWFRTGDQGVLDAEGYLSLTGRLKEIINRGGEKVSPREVDEILMDHPAVAQVVCFGMPHPKLGEEVAAVVVLREGQQATERELQAFVSSRAAEFKVPKKILFMDEIPKGATGKLQRIGLAAKLGLG
jgi:acyl-CoA synthetase (AMP-forming)/AMP-acid ligase II